MLGILFALTMVIGAVSAHMLIFRLGFWRAASDTSGFTGFLIATIIAVLFWP